GEQKVPVLPETGRVSLIHRGVWGFFRRVVAGGRKAVHRSSQAARRRLPPSAAPSTPTACEHRAAGRGDKAGHAFRVGLTGSRRGIEGRLAFSVPPAYRLAPSRAGSLTCLRHFDPNN